MGDWIAKGFLASLLAIAVATPAFGQTKSAQLPVPQRIDCLPLTLNQPGKAESLPPELTQPVTDALYALQHELSWSNLSAMFSPVFWETNGKSWSSAADLIPAWLPTEPLGTMWTLLTWR